MTVIAGPWPQPRPYLRPALELELGRWEDDGGTAGMTVPPLVVEIRPDLRAFVDAIATAGRTLLDGMRAAFEQVSVVWRRLVAGWASPLLRRLPTAKAARMRAAGRWHTDTPPRRWRDWQPSSERPADRARRQRLERTARRIAARRGGAA